MQWYLSSNKHTQHLNLDFQYHSPIKKNKTGCLEEWLVLGLRQEINKIRLKQFVESESKEGLRNKPKKPTMMSEYDEETKEPAKRAPGDQSLNQFSNKMNEIVLDYDPKYKINTHESHWYK